MSRINTSKGRPLLVDLRSEHGTTSFLVNYPIAIFNTLLCMGTDPTPEYSNFYRCAICEKHTLSLGRLQYLVNQFDAFAFRDYINENVICVESSGATTPQYKRVIVHKACVPGLNRVYSADRSSESLLYDEFSAHEIHAAIRDLTRCIPVP